MGSVRVGLASTDPSGLLASPVETVPRDSSSARTDLARIVAVAGELEAMEVIVGLPTPLGRRGGGREAGSCVCG